MFEDNNTRKAIIIQVHDGDTLDAEVDLGYNIKTKIRIRLARINAPEIFGDEKPKGLISKKFVEDNFFNKEVQLIDSGLDSFRRNLTEVYVNFNGSQVNLSDLMVNQKLAIYLMSSRCNTPTSLSGR
jgi:endonuclease YncB( thermonuclease family)